jgi:maltase-glucoamylase
MNISKGALGPDVVKSARNALNIRYKILPYYYTLFYKAHKSGYTVARPLFHEYASIIFEILNILFIDDIVYLNGRFPMDDKTYAIDKQFLIGPAFLVTPVLEQGKTEVNGYFPPEFWYDYHDGELIASNLTHGQWINFECPIDCIKLHVRGGYIMPTQKEANTTFYSRQNPFGLIVAPDDQGEAVGDLFYDDGDSDVAKDKYYFSTFFLRENVLKMNIEKNNYYEMDSKVLDEIKIFVKTSKNLTFLLNGSQVISDDKIERQDNQIILHNLNLPMNMPFEIEWTTDESPKVQSVHHPVIDCAFFNQSITEEDCLRRNCSYYKDVNGIPKCYISNQFGGYKLFEQENENYFLNRVEDLNLFKKSIDLVYVKVTHGEINSAFKMTRIQVCLMHYYNLNFFVVSKTVPSFEKDNGFYRTYHKS